MVPSKFNLHYYVDQLPVEITVSLNSCHQLRSQFLACFFAGFSQQRKSQLVFISVATVFPSLEYLHLAKLSFFRRKTLILQIFVCDFFFVFDCVFFADFCMRLVDSKLTNFGSVGVFRP